MEKLVFNAIFSRSGPVSKRIVSTTRANSRNGFWTVHFDDIIPYDSAFYKKKPDKQGTF